MDIKLVLLSMYIICNYNITSYYCTIRISFLPPVIVCKSHIKEKHKKYLTLWNVTLIRLENIIDRQSGHL